MSSLTFSGLEDDRLDVDESERGHRPVTLISDPWTTAITRFALSRQHLSAITVFRVV